MAMYRMPLCGVCRRLWRHTSTLVCDAYPGGIPEDILASVVDHREQVDGDRGLRFEPKDAAAVEWAEELFDQAEDDVEDGEDGEDIPDWVTVNV